MIDNIFSKLKAISTLKNKPANASVTTSIGHGWREGPKLAQRRAVANIRQSSAECPRHVLEGVCYEANDVTGFIGSGLAACLFDENDKPYKLAYLSMNQAIREKLERFYIPSSFYDIDANKAELYMGRDDCYLVIISNSVMMKVPKVDFHKISIEPIIDEDNQAIADVENIKISFSYSWLENEARYKVSFINSSIGVMYDEPALICLRAIEKKLDYMHHLKSRGANDGIFAIN